MLNEKEFLFNLDMGGQFVLLVVCVLLSVAKFVTFVNQILPQRDCMGFNICVGSSAHILNVHYETWQIVLLKVSPLY